MKRLDANVTKVSQQIYAIGTVRSLLGSRRKGEATLYLFQKHPLRWEHEYYVSRNEIDHVKVIFYVHLQFISVKNCWHSTSLHCLKNCTVLRVLRCFWNGQKLVAAACAVLPSPQPLRLFAPALSRIKVSDENNTTSTFKGKHWHRLRLWEIKVTDRDHTESLTKFYSSLGSLKDPADKCKTTVTKETRG
jgi:hypothetical protein